jgi:hypothetical protein
MVRILSCIDRCIAPFSIVEASHGAAFQRVMTANVRSLQAEGLQKGCNPVGNA